METLDVFFFDDLAAGFPAPAAEPEAFIARLAPAAADAFGLEAHAGGWLAFPAKAFNHRRGQFAAADFLSVLASGRNDSRRASGVEDGRGAGPGRLALGVTGVDLFIPRLNFIFGLADPRGGIAIISLHRLRPEFYGDASDAELLMERAVKEAVHEIGHVLGLIHCGDPACIMHFSNTIGDTDRKGTGFCYRCQPRREDRP